MFQQVVVHSAKNWEADVAKQWLPRRPNGLSPSCSTYDLSSRGTCRNHDPGPTELEGGRSRVQAQPAERGQVGASLPHREATRLARSQLAPASISPLHFPRIDRSRAAAATRALDRS